MMEIGREVKLVEFINTDVWGIEHALRWCHNLQNTWARSDSDYAKAVTMESAVCIVQSGSGVPIFITVSLCLV